MATYTSIIQPTDNGDMSISQLTPTVNDGSNVKLYASLVGAGDIKRALMRFSFDGVISPTKLTTDHITAASIILTSDQTGAIAAGKVYRIMPINSRWDEFTGTYNLQDGVVGWGGGAGLPTSGLDYSATALGSYTASSVNVGSTRTITITAFAELIAMIKDNHGVVFIADDEGSVNAVSIGASSNNVVAYRPKFSMTYYPPSEIANELSANHYTGYHVNGVQQFGSSGALYTASTNSQTDISEWVDANWFSSNSATVICEAKPSQDTSISAQDYVINLGNDLSAVNAIFFLTVNQFGTNLYRFRVRVPNGTFKSIVAAAADIENTYHMLTTSLNFNDEGQVFNAWVGNTKSTPVTGIEGEWTSALNATATKIGIANQTSSPFNGYIRNVIIGRDHFLTDGEQTTLYTAITAGTLTTTDLDGVFGAGNWVWWPLTEYTNAPTVHLGTLRDIELTGADSVELGKDKDIQT